MPFRAKGFRGRPPSGGDSGPGVTQYATVAELITASQGGLDPGYYEVTTVPDYHPQHPRIITYWDGSEFEPQISTGFEDRPDTTSEVWVFDAKEERFRRKRPDGERYYGSKTLGAGDLTLIDVDYVNTDDVLPIWNGNKLVTHPTDNRPRFYANDHGLGASPSCTLIFAGTCSTPYGNYAVALNVGQPTNSRWMSIGPNASFVHTWVITYFGSEDALSITPRSDGDVVIVSYNQSISQVTAWVNGVKVGPFSRTLTLGTRLAWLNSLNGFQGINLESEAYFGRVSGNVFSDSDAAAWTAWLQDRYGIPPL